MRLRLTTPELATISTSKFKPATTPSLSPRNLLLRGCGGQLYDADSGITSVSWIPIPSIQISGGTVDFAPGVYTLTGGMRITGGTVTGDEVTFFNTSVNPNQRNLWGEFNVSGNPR